jgi:hypothetical protein
MASPLFLGYPMTGASENINTASLSRLPVGVLLGEIAIVLLTQISASVSFST